MKRKHFLNTGILALASTIIQPVGAMRNLAFPGDPSLVTLDLPSPRQLRGGWAAFAAVMAARGWGRYTYATANEWYYDDGGGNWVCLRFKEKDKAILIGHDHEFSDTYFRKAARYFEEPETDLLAGAPKWWKFNINPKPFGEWVGFIYGWDGERWQRAQYDKADGFEDIGLLDACSVENTDLLRESAISAPGHRDSPLEDQALVDLIAADANITPEQMEKVVPGWDVQAAVIAGRKFLEAEI